MSFDLTEFDFPLGKYKICSENPYHSRTPLVAPVGALIKIVNFHFTIFNLDYPLLLRHFPFNDSGKIFSLKNIRYCLLHIYTLYCLSTQLAGQYFADEGNY